jgi:DNA-binding CsgD family transcriptional regulator
MASKSGAPRERHLRAHFALTPSELRLCSRLLTGESLRQAATRLGVTYETARTTLKIIFRKTHTRRQAELVLLLAQLERNFQAAPEERATRSPR